MSRRTFRLVVSALALGGAAAATTAAVGLALEEGRDATVPIAALFVLTGCLLLLSASQRGSLPRRARPESTMNEVVFDAFPEPALIVSDGRISAVNHRLCALLGLEREVLVGESMPFPFWPPEHRHELERWHKHLAKTGSAEAELTLRRSDGQRVPVLASGNSLPVTPGSPSFVISVRDITERRRVEDRLAALASHDPLTELLNEWGFQERLSEEVARARATGRALSVVLVQFDGLATQGDLAAAIQRFRGDLRAGEQISRTNESELAWILPEVDAAGAIAAVTRALGHVSKVEGDRLRSVRVSAGVCELGADHDAAVLYAFANRALRAARAQGGGTVVYSPEVTQLAH